MENLLAAAGDPANVPFNVNRVVLKAERLPTGRTPMHDKTLEAHSRAETQLYLMATSCASCGRGPLKESAARCVGAGSGADREERLWQVTSVCDACGSTTTVAFLLPNDRSATEQSETTVVNPTDEPSRTLDVGQ
jgi:hypothetical protein